MRRTATLLALATQFPLLAVPCAATVGGEPDHLEPGLAGRTDIVFHGGFEADAPGSPEWTRNWGAAFTSRISSATLVEGAAAGSRTLRVDYPKGGVGPSETGVQFPVDFSRIEGVPAEHDSLHLRYYVFFEPGFDFVKGGKLPGLMGGGGSWERSGGDQPDGTNGWTLRFMWRDGGEAVIYAYLPPGKYQRGVWGTDIPLGRSFTTGRWICMEQFVKVNTPGRDDGTLVVWMDGEEVLRLTDVNYRTVDNAAGRIGGFYVSTFHGGNTPDWGPSRTSYARFDAFVAARERVGPAGVGSDK
jgi:hypothetical protein